MLSIDEAIKEEQTLYDIAKDKYEKLGIKNCLKRMEEHKQYIEWMKELKELREYFNSTEIGKYRFQKGYNKAIDEFIRKCEMESRVILDEIIHLSYYGLSMKELQRIAEQLKKEVEE